MKRRTFSDEFKAKIVLEVLRGEKELNLIATENEIAPNQIRNWKAEFLKNATAAFDDKRTDELKIELAEKERETDSLYKSVSEASMGTTKGNTPVGNNYGVLYPVSSDTDAYGPYKRVLLTAMPSHPYSNRPEIMIHGGRSQTSLQPTHGCIRVFNSDQLLIQNKLETLMLPANGHNSTGTVIVSE